MTYTVYFNRKKKNNKTCVTIKCIKALSKWR